MADARPARRACCFCPGPALEGRIFCTEHRGTQPARSYRDEVAARTAGEGVGRVSRKRPEKRAPVGGRSIRVWQDDIATWLRGLAREALPVSVGWSLIGRGQIVVGAYGDAVQSFDNALRHNPGDASATEGREEAIQMMALDRQRRGGG